MELEPTSSLPIPNPENSERRARARQQLRALAYVDLGPGNGGVVLNLSEGGLALSLAMEIAKEALTDLTFWLPGKGKEIKVSTQVVWTGKSRKELGLRFERIHDRDARRIRTWISQQENLADVAAVSATEAVADAGSEAKDHGDARAAGIAEETASPRTSSFSPKLGVTTDGTIEEVVFLAGQQIGSTYGQPLSSRNGRSWWLLLGVAVLLSFVTVVFVDHRTHQRAPGSRSVSASIMKTSSPGAALGSDRSANITDVQEQGQPAPQSKAAGSFSSGTVDTAEIDSGPSHHTQASQASFSRTEQSKNLESNANRPSPKFFLAGTRSEPKATQNASQPMADSLEISDPFESQSEPSFAQLFSTILSRGSQHEPQAPINAEALPYGSKAATPQQTTESGASTNSPTTKIANSEPASKQMSGIVTLQMPAFPSIRTPAGMEPQATAGEQNVQLGQLVFRIDPDYPKEALTQQLQGTVKAHISISPDGTVESVHAEGAPILAEATAAALRSWRFRPSFLNGTAINADMKVTVLFRLATERH